MHFADGRGVVALAVGQFGPGVDAAVRQIRAQPLAVVSHAVADRVHSGEQTGPRGHADGMGGVGFLETDAPAGQTVDVRRLNEIGAVAAQKIRAELVGHQKEEVGTVGHRIGFLQGGGG